MKKSQSWQINIVFILFCVLWATLGVRLFYLQVLNHKFYQSQALGQQISFTNSAGPRGQIFCANSQSTKGAEGLDEIKSIAINKDEWTIAVNTKEMGDKITFAKEISGVLRLEESEINKLLEQEDSYIVIKKGLTEEDLNKIKGLGLKGLRWQMDSERFYPQGKFASQVVGFVGGENDGQYGLEGYYEDILKGKNGIQQNSKGLGSVSSNSSGESLNGSDIYLTIDYNIQFQAEALLQKARENLDISAGQIIVIKPDTGKVLALANFPSFDLNKYSKEKNLEVFQNGATQKLFEPGSIMKPFTMAMAINEGKITPDTTYVDEGIVKFGTKAIHNFANKKYGLQTMTGVLKDSINTGAVFAQQQISHEKFLDYIDKFGFTEKTKIDLQGETYSRNETLRNNGPDMNFATASFGQGIELTPMQIVRGFSALANGGKLVRPYIVEKIVNERNVKFTKVENPEQIISRQTSEQINKMLINVIDEGYNGQFKIPGYYLAGKTGTAQIPLKNGKGYESDDKTIQSFVGYGPAYNPQFLILVKLDSPKVARSALSAAPVFKELSNYIINYWQIPPDYDVNKSADQKK